MKKILFDELHVTVHVPQDLPKPNSRAIRRTLDDPRFRAALIRAIRRLFSRYPALSTVALRLTR